MLPWVRKMLCPSRKCVHFVKMLIVLGVIEQCTPYRTTYNHRIEAPFQFTNHKQSGIKNRFHPSTFSAEDSKEMDKQPDMPIQYAYDGGDSHEGEILVDNNHNQQHNHHDESHNHNHDHDHDHDHPVEMDHHHHDSHEYSPSAPSFGGYHLDYPYPPARPPPPKPLPHKSKQQNDAQFAYYYIGRQLWYVPLYFSIYFVAYVGLLVLKSIARHKVLLPQLSEQAATNANNGARRAADVQRSILESEQKYYM